MTEDNYILASAMVHLDAAVMSLCIVDLLDEWEGDNLALAEALRTVTASRDKVMTELERRVGAPAER